VTAKRKPLLKPQEPRSDERQPTSLESPEPESLSRLRSILPQASRLSHDRELALRYQRWAESSDTRLFVGMAVQAIAKIDAPINTANLIEANALLHYFVIGAEKFSSVLLNLDRAPKSDVESDFKEN